MHLDGDQDGFDLAALDAALQDTRFAGKLHFFPAIHSTNTHAMAEAEAGAPEGMVYFADEQTAGRGRGAHVWASPPGSGLYVSVLLRPRMAPADVLWLSLAAGLAVSVSGFLLLFPFFGTDIAQMQLAQVVHAVVAVLFVALILGHIYIGTLGIEGAFEAMGTGEVDLNWAKEHHDLWLAQQLANQDRQRQPSATPAE